MSTPHLPATRSERLGLALAAAAITGAVIAGARNAWLADDAFICFRYAQNWVDGLGLVFNAGERVEGYTNPLWTAWIALGMKLGASPERWTVSWGVACFAGTAALLVAIHREARRRAGLAGVGLPIGAIAAALHVEMAVYATSGLETSAFTCLSLAGLALAAFPAGPRRALAAGLLLGLGAVTRHDGVIFAAVGLCAAALSGARHAAAFAGGFAVVFAPVTLARIRYYGDIFPNTYHAKSGGRAWFGQGLTYLSLYLQRYWGVAAGLAAWIAVAARITRRREAGSDSIVRPGAVLVVAALAYGFYVVRVGGDFMFARLLIPATAPLLAAFDLALIDLAARAPRPAIAGAIVVSAGIALTPSPFGRGEDGHPEKIAGITDEHAYYSPEEVALEERRAAAVAPIVAGLPLRVAFYGREARFVYRTRVPVAIEGHTGLTDAFVAHQPLAARGAVGHEKLAPAAYLLGTRRVHLTFSRVPTDALGLDAIIPRVRADLGGVAARVLTWDPDLYAELRRRGAKVPDFPKTLDAYLQGALPSASKEEAELNYAMTSRFYFATVPDAAREDAFRRKLGLTPKVEGP